MAAFAEHELLSLHELLMGTALHARELKMELEAVQDPELRALAKRCLQSEERFVNNVAAMIR